MTTDQWVVTIGGLLMCAFVAWYFFGGKRAAVASAETQAGIQEVHVRVKGGYIPDTIEAVAGIPLRMTFLREETSGCSEEIVFPDFGVREPLPAFQEKTIELRPNKPGEYGFECGMAMMKGRLIIHETKKRT